MTSVTFDVGLALEDTHVLISGSSGAIGSVIVQGFLAAGAYVSGIDLVKPRNAPDHAKLYSQQVDITDEAALQRSVELAQAKFGVIATCILAAGVDLSYCQHHPLVDMPLLEWQRIVNVNLTGTFITSKAWLKNVQTHATPLTRNISAIILGSEAGIFGVADCAPYAATKSAIQYGFVKSLARDAINIHPKCRVNAIAPGPVATQQFSKECDDEMVLWREAQATVAMKQAVPMEAVARACLFLASENFSGNITAQVLPVDSGKSGALMWPPATTT